MPSPLLVSFEQQIAKLDGYFICRKADYTKYTDQDYAHGVAFLLLASAELEHYVEERCKQVADRAVARIRNYKTTSAGRALFLWYMVEKRRGDFQIPIHESDALGQNPRLDLAITAYKEMVKSTHGMDGKDLQRLAFPLALRDNDIPATLIESLKSLSNKRNPASHTHSVLAQTLTEPAEGRKLLDAIVADLKDFDRRLDEVQDNFPL